MPEGYASTAELGVKYLFKVRYSPVRETVRKEETELAIVKCT